MMPTEEHLPEPWLRGTLTEVAPVVRAVLHALELAKQDVWKWCHGLGDAQLNLHPPNIAPVAFHLRHIARSLDRLLTYAEGQTLNESQMSELRGELEPGAKHDAIFEELERSLERSKRRLLSLQQVDLNVVRAVGKRQLPTTVGGLLVHIADHTQRHVGQAITTAKFVALR
jgi:uncharacterized damage-inducible protein DinB